MGKKRELSVDKALEKIRWLISADITPYTSFKVKCLILSAVDAVLCRTVIETED
jgi:hypothetical protein